jgi:hypothetical protein
MLVGLDISAGDELADVAGHGDLHVGEVDLRPPSFGVRSDQVMHRAQRTFRSIDRNDD